MINRIPFNPDPKETAILTAMRQLESALNDAGYMVIITDMTNQDGREIILWRVSMGAMIALCRMSQGELAWRVNPTIHPSTEVLGVKARISTEGWQGETFEYDTIPIIK